MDAYVDSLDNPPKVTLSKADARFGVPGYPQGMKHGAMGDTEEMQKLLGRREVRGMRSGWHIGVQGLMTVVRVLPDELFEASYGERRTGRAGIERSGKPAAR